jgi:hypothetical protein
MQTEITWQVPYAPARLSELARVLLEALPYLRKSYSEAHDYRGMYEAVTVRLTDCETHYALEVISYRGDPRRSEALIRMVAEDAFCALERLGYRLQLEQVTLWLWEAWQG